MTDGLDAWEKIWKHNVELKAEVERLRDKNVEQNIEIQEHESEVIAYEQTIASLREALQAISATLTLEDAWDIVEKALATTEAPQ